MNENCKCLKILELPSWYIPDGGEFVQQQADALRRAGVDVAVAATCPLSWEKYKWRVPFFPHRIFSIYEKGVLTYRRYIRRLPRAENFNTNYWIEKTVELCEEYIKEHGKPDLIHVHSSMWAGAAALTLKRKYHIPYIITEHRGRFSEKSDPECLNIDGKLYECISEIFSNAELIIPVSSLLVGKIKSYLKKEVPIKVISNMIDTNVFHYVQRNERETFTFINVNHYAYLKGYDLLLDAFDKVAERHDNARLMIVGGGFDNANFKKNLSNCKYHEKINLCGPATPEKVLECLQTADCFVLPSRVESQSIAVLEALATGLPTVCTEVVPPETVTPERGVRVPVNDTKALADAMDSMILNINSYDRKKISDEIIEASSRESVTSQLLNIYNTIIYD